MRACCIAQGRCASQCSVVTSVRRESRKSDWFTLLHNKRLKQCGEVTISSVQSPSHVQLFVTSWTAAHQASLSIINSWSLLKLMSIMSRWCHPTISSSVIPFSSCLQPFLTSGSFLMSQFFASGGQSIGISASFLPMNIKGWFPLGWTGLTSLLSKRLLRVFSNTQLENINSLALSFLYSPTLTSIHDYWEN